MHSKPKIHKFPPASVVAKQSKSVKPAFWGVVCVSIVAILLLFNGFTSLLAQQMHRWSATDMFETTSLAPVSDAQAATLVSITDDPRGVVGQLTTIPSHKGPIIGVKTMSDVDRREGQELLSIVSKY